jgi:hypothetical protein
LQLVSKLKNMVHLFIDGCDRVELLEISDDESEMKFGASNLVDSVSQLFGIPVENFFITTRGGKPLGLADDLKLLNQSTLLLQLRLCGGIDFQHREGSKIGGGGTQLLIGTKQLHLENRCCLLFSRQLILHHAHDDRSAIRLTGWCRTKRKA